jgi:uncharacterized protein
MKIAIVGAGVSGLVAAHLLQPGHDITVFEAAGYAGGHTNTIRVDTATETHHIDTGFIVFNDRNYPNFERLLEELGVASQPSDMSFSVSASGGRFEYAATSVNGLYAVRRNLLSPSFQRMLAEVPRFQRACKQLLRSEAGVGPSLSLGDWLEREGFSPLFVQRLIVPQAAAVWSAAPAQMWSFPMRFLAEFFDHHGMLELRNRPQWRVVSGGSARYVEALTRAFADRIRLATPVRSVTRDADGVTVIADGCPPERFDRVVIATHSDQALALLGDPSDRERELLGAIPYQRNEAVLHTDVRMLPRRRRAWASWNFHVSQQLQPLTTVTYDMNRLQSLNSDTRYLVTLNRTAEVDPRQIIRTIAYAHPVFTASGARTQQRVAEISGANRTHYCGAYWAWGFHEDGVLSGQRVAAELGVAGGAQVHVLRPGSGLEAPAGVAV